MNFPLKNIEISLEESHILSGEKLLDDGKVTSLYESERNLWIATVDGFEVEMQISPSRVKACSCECPVFISERMCGHIAAGLLKLRKHLADRKIKRASPSSTSENYRKLTVNAILDQVEKEELHAFIRHFARKDRNFSLALKTRFAGTVPMEDNQEKYRQILDSAIKSARKKNDGISLNGARQVSAILSDLIGQATDAIALGHYAEGWPILQVILEKVMPVLSKADADKNPFIDDLHQNFTLIRELLGKPIPPELQAEIWNFLLGECDRYVYRYQDLGIQVFDLLLAVANDISRQEQLLHKALLEWGKRKLLSEPYSKKILSVVMQLFTEESFLDRSKPFYDEICETPAELIMAVQLAIEINDDDLASRLATTGLKKYSSRHFKVKMNDYLMEIAIRQNDRTVISDYAGSNFLATGELTYLRTCKKYKEKDWDAFLQNLVDQLEKKGDTETIALIRIEEKQFDAFAELVRRQNSLDFLMKYDRNFINTHQEGLYELYVVLLESYLSTHFGVVPTQKLLKLFEHLRKYEASRLVEDLVAFVRERYPRRMELAIELMTS